MRKTLSASRLNQGDVTAVVATDWSAGFGLDGVEGEEEPVETELRVEEDVAESHEPTGRVGNPRRQIFLEYS